MDRQLIAQKLEALRYCITRVKDKCPPMTPQHWQPTLTLRTSWH